MDKEQALQAFWEGFGVKAYDQSTVPDDAALPRITYDCSVGDFGQSVSISASVWDRATTWQSVIELKNQISKEIGYGGVTKDYDGGTMWITKGTPFAMRMTDPDDSIRRIVINVNIEYISED